MKSLVALALLPLLAGTPAFADIYTWTDKDGTMHVSNLPPPEGARVLRVSRAAPRDPEREAAARLAEVRMLDERLRQVSLELDDARRQPPPPPVVVIAPPPYYPPPPAPTIVNVVQPPAAYGPACDSGWGDCGFGSWTGFPVFYQAYPVNTWFGRSGKPPRRTPTPYSASTNPGQLIPPLIPPGHGRRKG